MSELISGKEALIAWYEGLEIEVKHSTTGWFVFNDHNFGITVFKSEVHQFRLKPRTITVNGIEVPCNKSKHDKDDVVWVISTACENWYDWIYGSDCDSNTLYWETEEEIKQVVAALRSVFEVTL